MPAPAVVETHVSALVFAGDTVFKFKKPLRFPFVDFTTREARLAACRDEVDANRRLSPDVYLGVADLVMGGHLLDHAVVMRRLPADRSLAEMAARHDPSLDSHLQRLANLLADFHARATRSSAIDADASVDAWGAVWRGCLNSLASWDGRLVPEGSTDHIERLVDRYLGGRRPLFEDRVRRGHVCDGHGDLLASDIYFLDDGPRVLDCIEFDPRLRHVDVIADVAFLAMDLEYRGAPALASLLVRMYQEAAGDVFPPTLVHHYCAQRALVRAEVACLRAEQDPTRTTTRAADLIDVAVDHLRRARVILGVVCGLPGTGKSTIASAAGSFLGWPVLRTDEVRRELVDPSSPGPLRDSFGHGAYDPAVTDRTYRTLLDRAHSALERGQPVLLDGTFADSCWQKAAEKLAHDTQSDLVVFECSASPDVTAVRLRARAAEGSDVSGADEEVARAMRERGDRWSISRRLDTGVTSTDDAVHDVVRILQLEPP